MGVQTRDQPACGCSSRRHHPGCGSHERNVEVVTGNNSGRSRVGVSVHGELAHIRWDHPVLVSVDEEELRALACVGRGRAVANGRASGPGHSCAAGHTTNDVSDRMADPSLIPNIQLGCARQGIHLVPREPIVLEDCSDCRLTTGRLPGEADVCRLRTNPYGMIRHPVERGLDLRFNLVDRPWPVGDL